jgi:hypothetical protein
MKAFLLATLAVALIGCSSGSKAHPPTPTTAAPAPTLPAGVTSDTSVPAHVPNNVKLRADVQIDPQPNGCHAVSGGWTAMGSAINPTTRAVTYTISVFFTTSQATVIATGQTKATVPPGAHQAWAITQHFTASAGTLCVLTGVA